MHRELQIFLKHVLQGVAEVKEKIHTVFFLNTTKLRQLFRAVFFCLQECKKINQE